MYKPARATGRTTKMLREAEDLSMQGKKVCVVVPRNLIKEYKRKLAGTTVQVIGMLENFDYRTMSVQGVRDTIYLIDHYVIEQQFEKILDMLHRYDYEVPNNG